MGWVFSGGGGGGYSPTDHTVEREHYINRVLSAEEMVNHWVQGVDAGKNLLWDALGRAIEQVADDMMDNYEISLNESEQLIQKTLDAQFEVLKRDKEAIVADARNTEKGVKELAVALNRVQNEALNH